MAIYHINQNELYEAYDINRESLAEAFDINGSMIFPDYLTVMSYNVQHFTGINGQVAMQRSIINDYQPYIIGFQEFSTTRDVPSVGQQVLGDYPNILLSYHINYNAIASKATLTDIVIADYVAQDPEEMRRWGETRCYMKVHFNYKGMQLCLFNTHLTVLDASVRYAQFLELFNMAEQENNVVILGDFNAGFSSFESDAYINTIKKFVDAGYNVMNNTPAVGITNTFTSATTASSLSDLTSNPDNIIVSGNIQIVSRVFDTIKLQNLNGDSIDHIAICATLDIQPT